MKNTTLSIISANTEEELVKLVNQSNKDFFATQPLQKNDDTWLMFCYSNKDNQLDNEKSPNEQKATEKQVHYLKQNKIPFRGDITKGEAFQIIKEHKKDEN